jgi:effector-binding domain-containing protein
MDNQFEIIEKAIGPVIEIEERVAMWRMPSTFGRDYKRIAEYLDSQGVTCSDMPYARYLDMEWEVELAKGKFAMLLDMVMKRWHFYAGMPTSTSLSGEGELQARVVASRRYARAVHHGPYQNSGKTYAALFAWIQSQGLLAENEAIEFYLNDPREVEKADLETVILIPLQ